LKNENFINQKPRKLFEKVELKQFKIQNGSKNYEELNVVDFDSPDYESDLKDGNLTTFNIKKYL